MGQCGSFSELWVSGGLLGNCGSFSQLWVIVGLLGKCGSVWVSVGQEAIVVRKEGSVGLLVNCGSVWVSVGQCGSGGGSSKKSRKCGSFSELWASVGLLGNFGSLWVRR